MVTKDATNGINSSPTFGGYQEFFKDFIVIASNYSFNRHLCDCFIFDIIDLNEMKFSGTDLEEEGRSGLEVAFWVNYVFIGEELDPNTLKLYVNCLRDLRILAKFLGFLESLPYKSDIPNLQGNVLELQIEVRSKVCLK